MTDELIDEANVTVGAPTATRARVEYDEPDSHRNALLCALVVAACVLITDPVANMPFSDGFSYDKTALEFVRTGHFLYNGWATAMLGWLIPWGALFIKVFGFSFTVMRLSMLPIDVATVYLFHQILRRFGINPQNAVLGTLTMSLSPLFLPLAASYMTDVPGLFVILLCIYMCQRAIAAQTDKTALVWLCSAMAVNVAGGTVRQIAWLGALVMVPSTAWLLRERRGMKIAGILLWVCSLISVLVCLHWFNRQPYSVPEPIIAGPIHFRMLVHLAAQLLKTFLCLLLVIFPVSAAWLTTAPQLHRNARLLFVGAMALLALLAFILDVRGVLYGWMMPWLTFLLAIQWNLLPDMFGVTATTITLWTRGVISLLVIAPALIFGGHLLSRKPNKLPNSSRHAASWSAITWILGPFSLGYVLLLLPRGTFFMIYDRYVLALVPSAIVVLLFLYQERVTSRRSTLSLVALTLAGIVSVGATHDFYAESRALASVMQMVQSSGVPRRSIEASLTTLGWASDGWAQIEGDGHINNSRIQVPVGAYNPNTPHLELPAECAYKFASTIPAISPKYFLVPHRMPCFAPTNYPPAHYTTWLPPFHQTLYVQQLKNRTQ